MILGEDLLLMSLDVASGLPIAGLECVHSRQFLAACLLAELAVQKQVGWSPDGIRIFDDLPSYHPLLSETFASLRKGDCANPAEAIRQVARDIRDVRMRMLLSLISRDLVHESSGRRFWLFGPRRYPVRSTQARGEAIEHLEHAATGKTHSMRSLALLLLADTCNVPLRLLPDASAREAAARAETLMREVREELPHDRDWSDTECAIALLAGIADALPHVI